MASIQKKKNYKSCKETEKCDLRLRKNKDSKWGHAQR